MKPRVSTCFRAALAAACRQVRARPGRWGLKLRPSLRCGCPARHSRAGALPNSLRSDIGNESEHEARGYTRRPRDCAAAARLLYAPTGQAALALVEPTVVHDEWATTVVPARPCPGARRVEYAQPNRRPSSPRVYSRASCSDSSRLFECRERSERREFGDGARGSRIAGHPQRSEGPAFRTPAPAWARPCSRRRWEHGDGPSSSRNTVEQLT